MFDVQKTYIFSLDILSFFLIALAFTVFIWVVPNTKVRFKYAILGGVVSGILFELERMLFSTYMSYNAQTLTIYGAFGIFMFFLMSLFFAACFILFGAEVAYVGQNFKPLLRAKKRWERRISDYKTYLSVRIMLDIIEAFLRKKKPPILAWFMKKYEMTETQAVGVLNALVHHGFLHVVTANGKEAYVPTQNFSSIRIRDVLDTIEDENRSIPITPDDFTKQYVSNIIGGVKKRPASLTDEYTFEKIISDIEVGEMQRRKTIRLGQDAS
jgi:membrane protein